MSEGYVFDGECGSAMLLAAQIRAGQVFPTQMMAWMERHPPMPVKPKPRPAMVESIVGFAPLERVPAKIQPLRDSMSVRALAHVSRRTGVTVEQIVGPVRCSKYVVARRRFSRIMRRYGYSLNQIGRVLHRDHATIIHYLDPKERRR